MKTEVIEFRGHEAKLAARLVRPEGPTRAYAIFAHCFTCSKDLRAAVEVCRGLAEQGVATLRFDFTGLGESEGEWSETHFTSNVEDLIEAARYLEAEHQAPALLVGHSLGGAAVLAAAGRLDSVKAVATIAAPFDPGHVDKHFEAHLGEIESEGEAEVTIAGRSFHVKKAFLEDIHSQDQGERIRSLKKALLVMHAPLDEIVGVANATEIFKTARHPKSFISLDGADHLLSEREDARYAGRAIAAWASRYLEARGSEPEPKAEQGVTVVRESGEGRFALSIQSNGHHIRADEPSSLGGDGTGPSPYDLLLASLGACTVMTIRMYAEHKKLSLTRVEARLSHEKIHAKDCEDCETKSGKIDRIERTLTIEGDLDDAQRQRLLEIADRCPVHRTLHGEIRVETSLA